MKIKKMRQNKNFDAFSGFVLKLNSEYGFTLFRICFYCSVMIQYYALCYCQAKSVTVFTAVAGLICPVKAVENVFEILPVKQEVKAMVGGIYIVSIKPLRGQTLPRPPKKSFLQRIFRR